ncbi:glutathione S-transferase [Roseospira marina]|uniref:Glutathione S-transferase n=1 Tax=Roseospira marina TaxID=140057 RepID=A0A5M6IEY2_9PROT|nr:glutathione S-transferase N-terminal domain-containing protein [Roseospira marina]KAA5606692.1 glutathione S-transferase [Roseospira marina]MBB4313895.1 GST-like protein [Roseospira marina]MBB5087057.1 GST-like protein [Roseospira marina]
MIDLYFWPTPNGLKISILLEELGVPYTVHPINITKGDQFSPEFLAISPNNRMPAIVDHEPDDGGDPISVFESGAILTYLADKHGQFGGNTPREKIAVSEWLFWQMGGLGPMAGQAHHFRQYAPETIPYAVDRYTKEVGRLYGVMNTRLGTVPFLAGESYSIADMAAWPWVVSYEKQGQDQEAFPNLKRWFDTIAARPTVEKGRRIGEAWRAEHSNTSDEARKILFGQTAR